MLTRCRGTLLGLASVLVAGLCVHSALGNDQLRKNTSAGVLVQDVSKGSAAEKAGIQAGDVLLTWESANPVAGSALTSGKIESPFDLAEIETERASRGAVSLKGMRGEVATTWQMPPGAWNLMARPVMEGEYEALHDEGKSFVDAKKVAEGVERWKSAGAKAEKAGDAKLAMWWKYLIARRFTNSRMWPEADAAYDEAEKLAEASEAWAAGAQIQKTHGTVFQSRNDWEHAKKCFQKEMELNEKIGADRMGAGSSWIDLGALANARGDVKEAEADYGHALGIYEKLAPESLAFANTLNNLGTVNLARGQMVEGEKYFERALKIKEKLAPGSMTVASTLSNLGMVASDQGREDEAENYLKRALEIQEKLAPKSLAVAGSLGNLGNVKLAKTQFEEAEKYFRECLAIMEELAPGGINVARVLTDLGEVAHARGDLAGAEKLYRRAVPIEEKFGAESHDMMGTVLDLGNLAIERGDLEQAEDYLWQSLAMSEKLSPGDVDSARGWNSLATIATQRADYDTANEYLERALKIMEDKEPESIEIATLLGQIGSVAYARKDLARAEEFYKRSLERAEKEISGRMEVSLELSNLGEVEADRGNLEAAQKHQEKSLAIVQQLAPDGLHAAQGLNALGNIARKKKDYLTAEKETKEALAIREKLAPGSAVESRSLHDLGTIYKETGKSDLAREYLCRAVEAVEKQKARLGGTHEASEAFSANFADYYADCLETLVDGGRAAEAYEILERERARVLLNMLAERDLLFTADIPAELTRERNFTNADYDRAQSKLAELSPGKDKDKTATLLSQLQELHEKQAEIAEKIRKASPRIASLQYPQPLDLPGTRQALDPGTLLLSYSVGREKSFLFVIQPAPAQSANPPNLSVFTLAIGEKALRGKVEAFRSAIQLNDADQSSVERQALALYELLIKPTETTVASSERLLILPDGPLDTLPFAALMRPESHNGKNAALRYLVEWKPIHTMVSATVYAETKKSRGGTPWTVPFEAFGDPKYAAVAKERAGKIENVAVRGMLTRGWNLGPLPFTRVEVESLAALEPQPNLKYLGEEATEEQAKATGKNVRYLHFAVHGLLDERFPLNSALALTIPEKPAEGQDNGLLQAWEIFEQVRINADLVTLSACDTALGKEMGGEGLVGLTRAFQYAGAHSVLASLWSVSDRSTAELMKRFYGYLKEGKSKDEALRAAQLELIHAAGAKGGLPVAFSHPFHWAAFQLSGDWK